MTQSAQDDTTLVGWVGPRWLRLVVGIVMVLLGAVLVFRPFASLSVLTLVLIAAFAATGVASLLQRDRRRGGWSVVKGIVPLVAAVLVLIWPGPTIVVVMLIVAVALLFDGIADLLGARRVEGAARYNAVVAGGTSVLLGILALAWPDITVVVVAIVFGIRMVIGGVHQVVAFRTGRDAPLVRRRSRRSVPTMGWLRLTGTTLGAIIALVLAAGSVVLDRDIPTPDAFYDAPATVPAQPGMLLRSEPFTSPELPEGALAWRILYTTTRDENQPAVASGLVIAPASAATTPSRVIAWAHGTTGVVPGCAPSVLRKGLAAGAMQIQDQVLDRGWTLVATDYVGLGTEGPHPYLIGQGEGRSVLDAIRAAHQLEGLTLAEETVVWGHSQGGHAALWTGMLAPEYAPELQIHGVAAAAPASDLTGLIKNLATIEVGQLFASYVVEVYTAIYPDVRKSDYLRPGARIISDEMASRCLAQRSVLVSALVALSLDKPLARLNPDTGAFGKRLTDNIPMGPIPAPLLIGQGAADPLIVPETQAGYVRSRCERGYAADYRTYPGRDHLQVIAPDSPLIPELLEWTNDRFEGKPACNTC